MPTLSNYPVSRPVLNLDFANTRVLDPRFTFTRASAGMRFNEQGILVSVADNVPRFEHDPLTGESRGLRIEAASTNLLTYSEDFSNAIWSKANLRGTLNALAAVAPDGATTATQYVENTDASVGRYLSPSQPFTSGTTYTFSIYAKAGTSGAVRYLGLVLPLAAFTAHQVASYDLSGNGTATVSAGTATATIKHVSRGWYRCTLTATATATTTGGLQIRITNSSTNGAASYTGDGASHIYIWGAQLEAQPRHTSYIKTTSATVTRAADYAEMTGSAFTSWFRADEGTVVVKAASLNGERPFLIQWLCSVMGR